MAANPNTITIKQVYSNEYQISHYTRPSFRAFATERFAKQLQLGDTFHYSYTNDFLTNDLGGNGSYVTQPITDTDETLVVNIKKEVSFQIPEWQSLQFNTPVVRKRARKAANRMWLTVDAIALGNLAQNSANFLDNQYFGGVAGTPILPSTGNILTVFTTAREVLESVNVEFVPMEASADVAQEMSDLVPAAVISPRAYNMIQQFVAGKNSSLGDKATMRGYKGWFMEFNLYVSNNLPWETLINMSVNPTNGDTLTIGGVLFTFVSVIGSTAGNILIAGSAALTVANVVALLNAPYTTTANGVGYVQANLTFAQQYMFMNQGGTNPQLVATQVNSSNVATPTTGTSLRIYVIGQSVVNVTTVFTSSSNVIAFKQQHCLFGTSRSIDMIIQRRPNLKEKDVSGAVATDYVNWNLWGQKMFTEQKVQMIDVRFDTTGQVVPTVAWN